MIETWGFYFFLSGVPSVDDPVPADVAQASFDRYLQLWTDCEALGFEGLSFAEHHFASMSMAPSTHLLIAAVAARTKKLRFNSLGSVLPLHDARRFVEECGMLDYLANGRFEPGIAPGAGPMEFIKAGFAPDDQRPRYEAAIAVLDKVVAGDRVTQHDAYNNLDDVLIVPRMRPGTGRSPWVAIMSPDSAAMCGARGYKMCTSWFPTVGVAGLVNAYRAAADDAGRAVTPQMLGLRRRVFVAATDSEAREKYEAAVDMVTVAAGQAFEVADGAIRKMMMDPEDFSIGSPETVAERLLEQCRMAGTGALFAFTDFAGFEHDDLVTSHRLIGEKVAPVLRSADVGAPTAGAVPTNPHDVLAAH